MAADYSLEITTNLNPEQLSRIVCDELGFEWTGETSLRSLGIFITIGEVGDRHQALIEEQYGFRPTVATIFEIYSDEDYWCGMRAMMRAVMAILRCESGDAVMLFNGEWTMLQRVDDKLLLNEAWEDWASPSKSLSEVTLPYELRHLRSPAMEEYTPTVA